MICKTIAARFRWLWVATILTWVGSATSLSAEDDKERFFRTKVEPWNRDGAYDDRQAKLLPKLGTDWWSLQKLGAPPVPGKGHPIDAFIRGHFTEAGIQPSREADRVTLIRRLYVDLFGYLPTPAGDNLARDTWPHFLVNQRMNEPIPLADFGRMDFQVSFQVDRMNKLSNWPNAIRGTARSGMNLKFMFFLRNRNDFQQKLFAGMMLFSSNQNRYAPHIGIEQHGNIFYRESIASGNVAIPKLSERRRAQIDVRQLVAEALRIGREKQPELSSDVDDYAIYNFSIGFEGMGHWETEAEISGLSLAGTPRELKNQ